MPGRVVEIPVETYRSLVDHLQAAYRKLYSMQKHLNEGYAMDYNREAIQEVFEAIAAIGGSV